MKSLFSILAATAVSLPLLSGSALAEAGVDAPETPATDIHGAPGNTPGFGGASANPEGEGVNGGDGIHNIDAAPGQGGVNEDGDRPAGNMHGGLADTTGYPQ